jgi:hypothetical protein
MAAFSQVYSENWEKKAEQKDLKNLQCGQKCLCKDGAKKGIVSERISTIKKKLNTFHQDNRKDVLRASQELARPYPSQAEWGKSVTSFESLSLVKKVQEHQTSSELPRKLFPQDSFLPVQLHKHSEASAAVVQGVRILFLLASSTCSWFCKHA